MKIHPPYWAYYSHFAKFQPDQVNIRNCGATDDGGIGKNHGLPILVSSAYTRDSHLTCGIISVCAAVLMIPYIVSKRGCKTALVYRVDGEGYPAQENQVADSFPLPVEVCRLPVVTAAGCVIVIVVVPAAAAAAKPSSAPVAFFFRPSLLCVFQGVFQATGAFGDVGVVGVVITFFRGGIECKTQSLVADMIGIIVSHVLPSHTTSTSPNL